MKKIVLTLCLFACLKSIAQNCNSFLFLQNNKTVEMTIYNRKGDVNGKQVYSISNVSNTNGSVNAKLNSEMFDKNGKSIAKSNSALSAQTGFLWLI